MMTAAEHTLGGLIRARARSDPEGVCLRFGTDQIEWRELDRRSNRVANGLIAEGALPGARIAYLGRNGGAYFEVLFGAAKAGAVMVGVNWRLAPPEVHFILSDAEIRIIFVATEFYPLISKIRDQLPPETRVIVLDGDAAPDSSLGAWRDANDDGDPKRDQRSDATIIQLYTSGTTGRPKGAEISHRYFFNALDMALAAEDTVYKLRAGETVLVTMPLFHIGGIMFAFAGVAQGCTLLLFEDFDPGDVLRAIDREPIGIVSGVPAMLEALLDHPLAAETDFTELRYFFYGASPMPPSLLRRAMEVMSCGFAQFYGMTESTMVTFLAPSDHDPEGNERMLSVGRALPGVEISIVDEADKELPPGSIGEIAIRTPVLMSGYWKRLEATADACRGDRFHTGDAGYLDPDGYLYLKDRVKDTIISGGENIYPAEVEHALYDHPSVHEVAVVGVPDETWGEVPKAFIVLTPDATLDGEDLRRFASERIARYKLPKRFESIEELPRTASGKVLRRNLRTGGISK